MLSKQLAAGLAVLAGLLLTSTVKADNDLIRLATNDSSANTLTLGASADDLDADTILTCPRYGGFRGGFYGGYRGGYAGFRGGYYGGYRGGFYGGYRGGFYAGYRGGYYGGYRGYYGGYRGYYGGYGYYPRYYSSYYYPSYYSYSSYYYPSYYSYSAYYPISGTCDNESRVLVIPPTDSGSTLPQPSESLPAPMPRVMPRAEDGTFPYDGGPRAPVPMPKIQPVPEMEAKSLDTRPTVIPFDSLYPGETLVSLKAKAQKSEPKAGKWNYPAYGEQPTRSK